MYCTVSLLSYTIIQQTWEDRCVLGVGVFLYKLFCLPTLSSLLINSPTISNQLPTISLVLFRHKLHVLPTTFGKLLLKQLLHGLELDLMIISQIYLWIPTVKTLNSIIKKNYSGLQLSVRRNSEPEVVHINNTLVNI